MKKLQVKCSGEPIRWADIVPLQPNGYKEQSELERDALIASMLTFGFNHPFAVWHHKGLYYSIDGVHRAKALKHLRDFGYNGESCEIPELLPSYSVEAETVEQAMAAILSYNEQYSTVANKAIIIEAAKLPATIIKAVMIKPPMVFNDSVRNNDSNNSNGDNGKSVGMGSVGDDLVVGGGESNVRYDNLVDSFSLPNGDRIPFRQMTFVLSDEQHELINKAIGRINSCRILEGVETFCNENKTGNAVYYVFLKYLEHEER